MSHWCFFFLENNYNHIYKGYNLEHLNNQYLCVCVCVCVCWVGGPPMLGHNRGIFGPITEISEDRAPNGP